MKTRSNFTRKFVAVFLSLVMVFFSFNFSARAEEEKQGMNLAEYTKTELQGNDGTYTLDLPLATAMEGFKDQMKLLADNGAYPHGIDGKNKIAYIRYNLTFPDNATIGDVTIDNQVSFINGRGITHTQEGQVLKFKIPLNDVNWKTIYNGLEADLQEPDAHKLNIQVKYTVENPDESKFIDASGDFSFYPSGMGASFGFGLQTLNTDVAKVVETGGDAISTKDGTIPSIPDIDIALNLEGGSDVEDTPAKTVYDVSDKADNFRVDALLNVIPVKDELNKVITGIKPSEVKLLDLKDGTKGVKSSFVAKIHIPEGVDLLAEKLEDFTLAGVNEHYIIESYEFNNDRDLTVNMILKNGSQMTNLQELSDAVTGMDDMLKLSIPLKIVKGNHSSKLELTGTFDGDLLARPSLYGHNSDVILSWSAESNITLLVPTESKVITKYKTRTKTVIKEVCNKYDNPTDKVINIEENRFYGPDRYITASIISGLTYNHSDVVILANGNKYTDVLTASPYANELNCPILYTRTKYIPNATIDEMNRLGVKKVIISGGEESVSKDIFERLKKRYTVERLGGADRYQTAEFIANRVRSLSGVKDKAIIASGETYPDALSISSLATKENLPILITTKDVLPKYTSKFIKEKSIDKLVYAGGYSTVSKEIEKTTNKLGAKILARYGGKDRYETSTIIAEKVRPKAEIALFASGEDFPDALVGGVLAGKLHSPIVLIKNNSIPPVVEKLVKEKHYKYRKVLGGESTISLEIENKLLNIK